MIQNITVIGAGSTGHAVAGIMSMRGFHVTLHDDERFSDALNAVKELGFIQLRGKIRGIGSPLRLPQIPQMPFMVPKLSSFTFPLTVTKRLPAALLPMWRMASIFSLSPATWVPLFSGKCFKKWALPLKSR